MTTSGTPGTPRELGAYERGLGYELRQNPYPIGTANSREWSKGWRSAAPQKEET